MRASSAVRPLQVDLAPLHALPACPEMNPQALANGCVSVSRSVGSTCLWVQRELWCKERPVSAPQGPGCVWGRT